MAFKKATKKHVKLRVALVGVSGSGKTYTALNIATNLAKPVAVIDTEHGSACKYSDLFDFDVMELESFSPANYVSAIQEAEAGGYGTLVIDSLSHAWMGKGGALEMVDNAAKRSQATNTFMAWRDVTPQHNALVEAILASDLHVIVTMRAKTEYVQEKNEKGKTVPRKVGIQPVQRDGMEYEFDVVCDLNQENELIVGKTRCPELHERIFRKAGKDVADILLAWAGKEDPSVSELLAARILASNDLPELRELLREVKGSPVSASKKCQLTDACSARADEIKRSAARNPVVAAVIQHMGGVVVDVDGVIA